MANCLMCGCAIKAHETYGETDLPVCYLCWCQYEEDDIYGAARNQERQVVLFGESDSDGT